VRDEAEETAELRAPRTTDCKKLSTDNEEAL